MKNQNVEAYRTGQGVPVDGEYICHTGEKLKLKANDKFPVCPVTGVDTKWASREF